MDERERRRRKRKIQVYTMRFLAALAAVGILSLLIFAGVGIFRRIRGGAQETMAVSDEDMEVLNGLKEQMKGKEFILILDAGHGGNDVGTGNSDYYEKDINMDIVKEMKEMLEFCGVEVVLTREGDETVALDERSSFANESKGDRFVSIHCNYCEEDASVAGLECYYWADSMVGESYAKEIISAVEESGKVVVRGIKTEDFHVLRETRIPAVLVETGYISNQEDRENLYDAGYQKTLSVYLVKGIIEGYLHSSQEISSE